jgi:hypothetical protein
MPQQVQFHRVIKPGVMVGGMGGLLDATKVELVLIGNLGSGRDAAEVLNFTDHGTFTVYTKDETDTAIQASGDAVGAKLTASLIEKLGPSFMETVLPTIQAEIVKRVQQGLEDKYASELNNLKAQIKSLSNREGVQQPKGE